MCRCRSPRWAIRESISANFPRRAPCETNILEWGKLRKCMFSWRPEWHHTKTTWSYTDWKAEHKDCTHCRSSLYLPTKSHPADSLADRKKQTIRRCLGTRADIPHLCTNWSNPPQSRWYSLHFESIIGTVLELHSLP